MACGIATIYGSNVGKKLNQLKGMLKRIKHRGYSLYETKVFRNCVLGCNRLEIIDKKKSTQPLSNENGNISVIFNGEIYNYQRLMKELKDKKHKFKTRSDTEVLIHAYEEWGKNMINKLDGIFAFFIYDQRDNSFLMARDRMGIKPLYMAKIGDILYVASEIKSFLDLPINPERIEAVKPGYYVTEKENKPYKNAFVFEDYWHKQEMANEEFDRLLAYSPGHKCPPELFQLLKKKLREVLDKAVKKRIPPDEDKIGVFLSGGVDSSAITYLASKYTNVIGYTVGIGKSEDLKKSELLCNKLGIKHRVKIINLNDKLKILKKIVYHLETFEPMMVEDSIPIWFATEMAKKDGVRVMLCGDGSDDVFGSYERRRRADRYLTAMKIVYHTTSLDVFEHQRLDRIGMAHTVEVRVPFMDQEFLEFILRVPVHLKLVKKDFKIRRDSLSYPPEPKGAIDKFVLRKAFENLLPKEIVWRPKSALYVSSDKFDLQNYINKKINYKEFEKKVDKYKGWDITTKRELFYFEIWKKLFPKLVKFPDKFRKNIERGIAIHIP